MADTNSPYAAGTTVALLENSFLPPTGKLWDHWQVVDADDQEITVLDNSFTMPSNDVNVTAIYREANTYQLVTDLSQVIAGRHYLIATGKNGDVKAMGDNKGNNRDAVDVTATEGHITETPGLHEFVISGSPLENEWWSLFDVTPEKRGYLYSGSGNNNYLKTLAESQYASLDDNGKWIILINDDDGQYNAILTAQGTGSRKLMRYNSTNKVFSCYQSGQQPVYLYAKDGDKMSEYYSATTLADLDIGEDEHHTIHAGSLLTVTGTLTSPNAEQLVVLDGGQLMHHSEDAEGTFIKNVTGYPSSGNKGWTFVSSPLSSTLTPSVENGWLSGNYDLYAYDEATAFWRNHKATPFIIQGNGKGYLYANATTTTLSWTGTLHPCDGTATVPLEDHPGQELSGWNLVGNPFTCNAYANRSHYRMNSEGSNMIAVLDYEDDPLPPCTGIMVKATESNDNVIFSSSQTLRKTTRKEWLEIQVVDPRNNDESLDKAFVCLHPEDGLEKYFFQATEAAIWIPFQDKAYAIVSVEETQELPVNFKAHTDGEYTITVSGPLSFNSLRFVEGCAVQLSVLRFIDNLTGADIDLLLEPSYTFEAKTSDYASRFKLVFGNENNGSTNSPQENGDFAFISNGSLIINGEGTVQLYDVLGRILLTRETTPNSSLLTPNSPGAYVLRLIDGSGVKTQKIIVKP